MDNSFGFADEIDHVRILQSCNGLLLCNGSAWPIFYYVYNPSINLFKRLLQLNYSHDDSRFYSSVLLRMAFDPRKSLYYKVVQAGRTSSEIVIQNYSSETRNWSMCRHRFNYFSFDHFENAINLNDAFYWLETRNKQLKHFKLNIEDHDNAIITRVKKFLWSFGGHTNDPFLLLMKIPQMLHLEGKFFESRGCLLLVCKDDIGSREFTIYEMMQGFSVWSVRYLVNTEDFMNLLPEGWSIRSIIWSIGLGEREDSSFLVINLSGNVVKYNLISKTISQIFDIGSNQMDDDYEFFPPYIVAHNLYEFISSFASV
ncbi:hypothetical protein Tco_0693606 [Tanacetum coccineum]